MWRTQANAFPTLSFEEIRNPRKWHRTMKERRNTDIQNFSDPSRRNIIATTAFSAFQLNDLIARVAGEYTANELIKGLTDAGAAEAALRVAEMMQNCGHGEGPLREYAQEIKANKGYMRDKDDYDARGRYVQSRDKRAPRGLEFAKALMGRHLRDKSQDPTHAECRLYKFLQYKEQELQEGSWTSLRTIRKRERRVRGKGRSCRVRHRPFSSRCETSAKRTGKR